MFCKLLINSHIVIKAPIYRWPYYLISGIFHGKQAEYVFMLLFNWLALVVSFVLVRTKNVIFIQHQLPKINSTL